MTKITEKFIGYRKDGKGYAVGSLLYDSDQDCNRIVTSFFDIENPKLEYQFGVNAHEVCDDSIQLYDHNNQKEICPRCHSQKHKGEGKGIFPVCKGYFICSDCEEIYNTMSDFYRKRYKEITGEYWKI